MMPAWRNDVDDEADLVEEIARQLDTTNYLWFRCPQRVLWLISLFARTLRPVLLRRMLVELDFMKLLHFRLWLQSDAVLFDSGDEA